MSSLCLWRCNSKCYAVLGISWIQTNEYVPPIIDEVSDTAGPAEHEPKPGYVDELYGP